MVLIVIPVLTGVLLILLMDIHYNTIFYDAYYGGDPIFYQHIFWFFGHPEVYILMIPGLGLVGNSSILLILRIFGFIPMSIALLSLWSLGTIVWSHHMFIVSLDIDSRTYYMISTMSISLPTGTKIISQLTLISFSICISTNNKIDIISLYIHNFILMISIGGSTGVILSNNVIDVSLHDSYYVI